MLDRLAHRLIELPPVGAGSGEAPAPVAHHFRHRDRLVDQIAVNLEIAWPVLGHDGAHEFVHLICSALEASDAARIARYFLENPKLTLNVLGLVMHTGEFLLGFAGSARHHQQGDLLGVGTGDRVDHVVPTRTVGHAEYAELAGAARISIRCKPHGGLVGEGDDLEPALATEAVEKAKDQIPGQTKKMGNPGALEIRDEKVPEGHLGAHLRTALAVEGPSGPGHRDNLAGKRPPRVPKVMETMALRARCSERPSARPTRGDPESRPGRWNDIAL